MRIVESGIRETRDSIKDIWGKRTPYRGDWPERVDERIIDTPQKWVQSACILCSNGCGLDIGIKNGKMVGVRGRGVDRVNHGRLGPKGLHGWIANSSPDRLTRPLIRRGVSFKEASWDEAMDLIVSRTKSIRERFTSSAIGFYTSGQLLIEEYYTLGVIAKAGIGTPHMDGNTRLCTATAAASLMETFGSDGQPGCYEDIDVTDAIFHAGHNTASQQTVLWMRVLDRLNGANPPKLIVLDPRKTFTARESHVHLAPRLGTNVAVMNGILNLIIKSGQIDNDFIKKHTIGFDSLAKIAAEWTPDRVEKVAGIPSIQLQAAADILGSAPTLVSTVLQGFYQSMQATAASVQVNNMHLLRNMIGRPGSGILQMNGQPTAQNTRETGCDGTLPGFRNWDNQKHMEDLAQLWKIDVATIPHWSPPTHAMQIFRYAESGSIKMLWISATNPAVSLPELHRIRSILSKNDLFVVVQDAFHTETTELADVVLPAAIWGEKTGCFTNADRTVHISHKAIEPPGEARPDLDIFVDYAQRMDFRDKDGAPLIKWKTPADAFEAWKGCTAGQLCDYSGLSYAKLSMGSGIQWPCNEKAPDGTARLYADGVFRTDPAICETYGHDLETGAAITVDEYKAMNPQGRAILKGAGFQPPHEVPDSEYPFWLTTGRLVYHWHTRTKTARSMELNEVAPDAFVQISEGDAAQYGLKEGDLVQLESRRGRAQASVKTGGIDSGQLFMPFHYGYWDGPGRPRAANELTITEWDPVSKQPHFKYAAVRLKKISRYESAVPELNIKSATPEEAPLLERKSNAGIYISMLFTGENELADAFANVAERHKQESDVFQECMLLSSWSSGHVSQLRIFRDKYPGGPQDKAEDLRKTLFTGPRKGAIGLLMDLHDLYLMTSQNILSWTVLLQAAHAMRDKELESLCQTMGKESKRQLAWLQTRIKQSAPQTLVVPK